MASEQKFIMEIDDETEVIDGHAESTIAMPEWLDGKRSMKKLYELLTASNASTSANDEYRYLLTLSSFVCEARVAREEGDDEYIERLSLWISKTILPDGAVACQDEFANDAPNPERDTALKLIRRKATLGLSTLCKLQDLSPKPTSKHLPPAILFSIIAFSSSRDSWTTTATLEDSAHLLSQYTMQTASQSFLIDYLVQQRIRPLFTRSKLSAITSTGRKAPVSSLPPPKSDLFDLSKDSKPWKYEFPYSITIFEWVVSCVSQDVLKDQWHLFLPPLLTILDDTSTAIRRRGLEILSAFLPKLNKKILKQTGLGEVFEDAVMPTLLYLPSITPLQESLVLLPAAYRALFVLCDVRFNTESEMDRKDMLGFLDRVTRKGILTGYLHALEHPSLVTILLTQLTILNARMGIHTVKHLNSYVPILSTLLTNPFATADLHLLENAIMCLRGILLTCWPRVRETGHRRNVIKMMVVAWKTLQETKEDEHLKQIKMELKGVGRLFVKAIGDEVDMQEELGLLIQAEPSLKEVFGVDDTK